MMFLVQVWVSGGRGGGGVQQGKAAYADIQPVTDMVLQGAEPPAAFDGLLRGKKNQ